MVRVWSSKRFLLFMSTLILVDFAVANDVGFSKLTWSDIGNGIVDVEKRKVQKSYDEISKDEGLFSIGAFVKLSQDINLRLSPGGEKIKPILKGAEFQILGVEVTPQGKRFYKVRDEESIGYVYGGTKSSYNKWLTQVWSSNAKVLAQPGDQVKIKRKKGASLKASPDLKGFYEVPKGSRVRVNQVTQTEDGKIFYRVKYKSKSGFIEVGRAEDLVHSKVDWSVVR